MTSPREMLETKVCHVSMSFPLFILINLKYVDGRYSIIALNWWSFIAYCLKHNRALTLNLNFKIRSVQSRNLNICGG